MIHHVLVGDDNDNPVVVVAFGYDTADNIIFQSDEALSDEQIEKKMDEAYANLDALPAAFSVIESASGKILNASGEAYSSEYMLSKKLMMDAHRLLGTDELLVSVPRRTCMMTIPKSANRELVAKFLSMHLEAYDDDSYGNAPITDLIFVVINGEVDGSITIKR